MKHYERPVVLASYSVQQLVEEAAVCMGYGGGIPGGGVPGGRGPVGRGPSVGPAVLPDTGGNLLAGVGFPLGGIATGISLLVAGAYARFKRR
jgi:hypothetical protein